MSKTNILINRIQQVDNFLNVASVCANWQEFTQELEEWGVYSAAKIDFDDKELDVNRLDSFILGAQIIMYIVFTKPNKFTKTYTEACQIAEDYYNNTGEVVAVEKSELGADYQYLLYTNSP